MINIDKIKKCLIYKNFSTRLLCVKKFVPWDFMKNDQEFFNKRNPIDENNKFTYN